MFDLGLLTSEVAFLIEAAGSAPSADNSQPWCFEWDGNILTGRVHHRGGFPVDYHATKLALGASAENLVWAMRLLGLDMASWYLGTSGENGVFMQGPVTGSANAIELSNTPLWKLRHTNRLPYRPEIDPDVAHRLAASRVNNVGVKVIMGSGIQQAADWVRQASEIRFQTREANEWFAASLRYGASPEDFASGLHVDTLALPPGGVGLLKLISDWRRLQWLNRLRAYKLFAAIEAVNFQKTPLVVAIIGPSDQASAFDAGRCLQQVWLNVTGLGLSAQPYYVVADLLNRLELNSMPEQCMPQAVALQNRIHSEYGNENTVHCLLRIGKPIGVIKASGRLPLNEIICGATHQT